MEITLNLSLIEDHWTEKKTEGFNPFWDALEEVINEVNIGEKDNLSVAAKSENIF